MSTMNLYEDWSIYLAKKLCDNGIKLSEKEKKGAAFYYFDFLRRKVAIQKRKIHVPSDFKCPIELLIGWNNLKERIELGEDINPYLSKGSERADAIDKMFNQWDVKHFHIGKKIENKFCERTGALIFAIVKEQDFYVIGLYQHGDWTQKSIIEQIHYFYPFVIERYKVTSMFNISGTGSQDEIDMSRRLNVISPVKLSDGTVYLFGDMTISGHNVEPMQSSLYMMRCFTCVESHISKFISGNEKYQNSEFNLKVINDEKYLVTCDETGFEFDATEYIVSHIKKCLELIAR
jgi:hypothetical protein